MDTLHLYPSSLSRDAALDALPAAAWTHLHRTFAEFIADLDHLLPFSDKSDTAKREVRGVARQALLIQAAGDAQPGELDSIAGSERALLAAGKLIAAWKSASLRPNDLKMIADEIAAHTEASRAGRTVQRLAKLYELYELRLGKTWTDREGAERVFLRRLESCGRIPARLLKAGARVALHGFHKLAYFQFRIAQKLTRLNHEVIADSPIFCRSEFSPLTDGDFSGLVKTFGSARIESSPCAGTPRLTRFEAPSPYTEVYEIGRRVRRWISDDRIPPASIAVAFRDLGPYSQAIHDVFGRLGIPFYERRGEPAQFQPLVRVALSAIDACVAGLDRRSVFRFLCAGPVDVAALAGVESGHADPNAMRDLAVEAGIDCMYGDAREYPAAAWKERLKRFQSGPSGARASSSRAHSVQALGAILERMNALRVERTAFAHAQAWRAFFECAGLSAGALSSNLPVKEKLALSALESALAAVASIPGAAVEKITLESFAELVSLAVQEESIRADGTARAGVHVLNFYDLRGLRFKRLCIGGMTEGLVPARQGSDPLLGLGAERVLRQSLAARLNDREAAAHLAPRLSHENAEEERALFASATCCAQEELLLSRPLRGFDGAAQGASEYWEAFNDPIENALPIHPAPPLGECLTAEESELRAAWILGGGSSSAPASEPAAALDAYEHAPRLKTLAGLAAVERARYTFFLDQAVAAAKVGEEGTARKPDRAGIYDGIVASMRSTGPQASSAASVFGEVESDVAKRLAPGGIGDPVLAPSDLEKLAECPFRFLTDRVCRFNRADEPGGEISPLDAGSLFHAVLNSFYKERLDDAAKLGQLTARLDRKRRAEYLNRLLQLAGEELFKTASAKFTGHPGFWKLQDERLRALLGTWLDCEFQEARDGFFPARVEFEFGPEAANGGRELAVPLTSAASLRIKGRMDRLDFKTEDRGGVETVVAVRVIDYKLGRGTTYAEKTKPEVLSALLSAQLPIYVAAAVAYVCDLRDAKKIAIDLERIWNESRAGYYSLRDTPQSIRGTAKKLIEVKDWPLETLHAFLATSPEENSGALFDVARRRVLEMLSGRFPVRPLDCGGIQCAARYSCRYQAIPAMAEEE